MDGGVAIAESAAINTYLGDKVSSALGPREELTGGLNVYFGRSAYKVQLDYGYLWRDQRSEGIHQVRALVQVSF